MSTARHQAGEMSHIDQEQSPDLVGDLAHTGEVDDAWVRAASSDDQLWFVTLGDGFQDVVVDPLGLLIDAVEDYAVKLAGKAKLVAVSQMAAVRQVKPQDGVTG